VSGCDKSVRAVARYGQLESFRYFFDGMYFQFRALPSASHFIVLARRSFRVSSRFASVIHSMYSRRWLGGKPLEGFPCSRVFL